MPPRKLSLVSDWKTDLDFRCNAESKMIGASLHNVRLYLKHHPYLRGLYWYDEFADEIMIDRALGLPVGGYPRPIQDHDETELAQWLNSEFLSPSIANTAACLRAQAFSSPRNALAEWANGLQWDGKPRLDTWLTYYAGAEASEYTALVGRRFLISAMARLLSPGCKVDTMLILEGPQGLKKSSLVRAIAGDEWFSDQVGEVTNKDASQLIQGIWIMEIPEMDKFNRAEANAVKDFLTRRFDRYRPPYGRNVVRRERRCVFFGTINPDGVGYLKDTTGNRRYWPVKVTAIDLDGVVADREQLWAEAKVAYNAGEKWWIDEDEVSLVEVEQDARRDEDPWEARILAWLEEPERKLDRFFTASDVMWKVMSIQIKDQTQGHKSRVGKILGAVKTCMPRNNQNGIKGRSWEYTG